MTRLAILAALAAAIAVPAAADRPDAAGGHMHRARYTLDGPDRFTTVWDFVKDGRTTFAESQQFTRRQAP